MIIKSPIAEIKKTEDTLAVLAKAIDVIEPTKGYDKLAVSCSMNTLTENGVDVAIHISASPYRVLEDGTVEKAPGLPMSYSIAGINGIRASKDEKNTALCTKVDNLVSAINAFLELM